MVSVCLSRNNAYNVKKRHQYLSFILSAILQHLVRISDNNNLSFVTLIIKHAMSIELKHFEESGLCSI